MHGIAEGLCCTHDALTHNSMFDFAQVTVQDTELRQEVRVVNSGEQDLSFTAALHSYFCVGDIAQVCATSCILLTAVCERVGHPVVDGPSVPTA